MYARGFIIGINRDTMRNQTVRTPHESIRLQTADILGAAGMWYGLSELEGLRSVDSIFVVRR